VLRGDNLVKILPILHGIRFREVGEVDVGMTGRSMLLEVMRPQESWVIVSAANFVAASQATEQLAAFTAVVTDRTTEFCHSHRVCQD
jgi:hypothetical protein